MDPKTFEIRRKAVQGEEADPLSQLRGGGNSPSHNPQAISSPSINPKVKANTTKNKTMNQELMEGMSYFDMRVNNNKLGDGYESPVSSERPKVKKFTDSATFATEITAAVMTIDTEERKDFSIIPEEMEGNKDLQELGKKKQARLRVGSSSPRPTREVPSFPTSVMATKSSPKANNKPQRHSPRIGELLMENPAQINEGKFIIHGLSQHEILEGEEPKINTETYFVYNTQSYQAGKLIMTNYRLRFVPHDKKFYKILEYPKDYYSCALGNIKKIDKYFDKKSTKNTFIEVSTKDMRQYKYAFVNEFVQNPSDIYMKMINSVFPSTLDQVFAFKHKISNIKYEGWNLYNDLNEFTRMGLEFDNDKSNFQLFFSNIEGEVCQTYPQRLILPKNVSYEDIEGCAQFRTKNRFPENDTSIWRSAQVKEGLKGNKSDADIYMIRSIIETLPPKSTGDPHIGKNYEPKWQQAKLHIYDARPYWNALANRVGGGGFEKTNDYPDTYMHFCKIENIHKVRDAYNKIFALAINGIDDPKWFTHLENSGWLQLLSTILVAAKQIVDTIKAGKVALIHCSDGWDRTAQLASLATILLDKYYRTMEGFEILIEKDWRSFGHQFSKRLGHIQRTNDDQQSPIFIQFLDCVYQIMKQFPTIFEFNTQFLLELAEQCTTHKYGTFLFNCDRDRRMHYLKEKTISIWSHINSKRELYLNPFYEFTNEKIKIIPDTAYNKLSLWKEYFLKWSKAQIRQYGCGTSEKHMNMLMNTVKNRLLTLEKENAILRQQVGSALNKLEEKGISGSEIRAFGDDPKVVVSKPQNEGGEILSPEKGEHEEDGNQKLINDYVIT